MGKERFGMMDWKRGFYVVYNESAELGVYIFGVQDFHGEMTDRLGLSSTRDLWVLSRRPHVLFTIHDLMYMAMGNGGRKWLMI